MLTAHQLQELLNDEPGSPIISLYINTMGPKGNADTFRLRLRNLLKQVNNPTEKAAIEQFFDLQHDWTGQSVVVFSCAAEDYLRVFPLAIPVNNCIHSGKRPYVKPLADLLDTYGGYGVALIDKQQARLFAFHLGELQAQEEWTGKSIKRTKQGGSSPVTGRRGGVAGQTKYIAEAAERNMKEAASVAIKFLKRQQIRRVLIAGTEDNVALFRSLLPKTWQSLVVGVFPMEMNASSGEVLKRALEVGQQAEAQREASLLNQVLTSAAKGHDGVIRLADTLRAVHQGRVLTLLISEGFHAPGYRCTGCGYVTSEADDQCPFCAHAFEQIPDAVELAVRRVMQDGGKVEVLHDMPALVEAGSIGALLRY